MSTQSHVGEHHGTEAAHPGPKTYLIIAVILSVITLIEFWMFYLEAMKPFLVPVLGSLSVVKFALVGMFFMHLKFDNPVFTRMLLVGIFLAFAIYLALLALFSFSHPIMR